MSVPFLIFSLLFFLFPAAALGVPPTGAVKFIILQPSNSTVGTPVTVTIEARKQNNQVDTSYQNDVTLVTSGSATGGGLVDIVNGVGTLAINDLAAETVTLSLSDTQSTGLDVSSTIQITFSAAAAAVWNQIDFWFRDDDGGEATATGWGRTDATKNSPLRLESIGDFQATLRLRISLKAESANGTIIPLLQVKKDGSGDCLGSGWSSIGGTPVIRYVLRDSPEAQNRASTTQQIIGGPSFVSGLFLDTENPAPSRTLLKNEKTEYEWSLQDIAGWTRGETYSFRVTNNGTPLDTYTTCPAVIFIPVGAGAVAPTAVSFSGRAFPAAKILIVDKDTRKETPLRQDIVTSEDGKFRIDFVGVLQSMHSFGLVVKDKENRATQSKFFNIDTLLNSLTVKDILVPPTLDFVNSRVSRGGNLVIRGTASPEHSVQIEIDSKIKKEVRVEKGGSYKLTLPTGDLDFGPHKVRVKQADPLEKKESDFSIARTFTVSRLPQVRADLSGDGKIDIKDWSMFLSQWSSKDTEKKKIIDFNGDGKVDISDFSIFVRNIRKR